jgi:hypothetical protein
MVTSQIRQNQQIYLRNMALLAIFAGEIAKRRQKIIFAVGVRGEPSFFICVLNPVKYTDPDGRIVITASVVVAVVAGIGALAAAYSLKKVGDVVLDAYNNAPPPNWSSSNQRAPTAQEQANAQTDTVGQGLERKAQVTHASSRKDEIETAGKIGVSRREFHQGGIKSKIIDQHAKELKDIGSPRNPDVLVDDNGNIGFRNVDKNSKHSGKEVWTDTPAKSYGDD